MSTPTIDLQQCDASPFCPVRQVCPNGAVVEVPGGYTIDETACSACGTCVHTCPRGAVRPS